MARPTPKAGPTPSGADPDAAATQNWENEGGTTLNGKPVRNGAAKSTPPDPKARARAGAPAGQPIGRAMGPCPPRGWRLAGWKWRAVAGKVCWIAPGQNPADACDAPADPATGKIEPQAKRRVGADEALKIGTLLGVAWDRIPLDQFRRGMEVEFEHGSRDPQTNVTNNDAVLTGKIAWAHLKEFPDYYTRLDRLEAEAQAYWESRR